MTKSRKEQIGLQDLIVNPKNYRFDPVKDEEKALITMMQSLGVEVANLARDISSHGLNPLRFPLVVFRNGNYIVLDGNRRTSALKLLDDPELIKENYPFKQDFKNLKSNGYIPPQSIEAIVYDDKDLAEADRWVYLEHNGKNKGVGTVNWGAKEKARFSSRHNKMVADKALQLLDFLATKKINTLGVDPSNLNRILADPLIRKRMGVNFVKSTLSIDDEDASLPNIIKVTSRLKAKKFKVRLIYSKDDRKIWIDQVLPLDAKKTQTQKKARVTAKPPHKTFLGLIDPSEKVPAELSDKIKDLHGELIKINVSRNPHATAALLRIYMELLSKECLMTCLGYQERGEKLVDASGQGDFSELKAKLGAIQTDSSTPKDIKSSLKILIAKDLITLRFNQVMHSIIFRATEPDLRSMWTNLKPAMDYAAREIAKARQKSLR